MVFVLTLLFVLCPSKNTPLTEPVIVLKSRTFSAEFTRVTPANWLSVSMFWCSFVPVDEWDATPMLFENMLFVSMLVFMSPVLNIAIWFSVKVTFEIVLPEPPVFRTPAWQPFIVPPVTLTSSLFASIMPTLEDSPPGPAIVNPFRLMVMLSAPAMSPSVLHSRFAESVTLSLTTWPQDRLVLVGTPPL